MKSKTLSLLFGVVAILFAQTTLANKISIVDINGDPIKEGNSANAIQFSLTCSGCTISGILGGPRKLERQSGDRVHAEQEPGRRIGVPQRVVGGRQ